jgi:uncharacterized protein YjbJ (UPF0337 family)
LLIARITRSDEGYQHERKYGQGRGIANEAPGKVNQEVGKAAGSDKAHRRCGTGTKSDAQLLKGDAKNAVKDGVNKVADAATRSFNR